MTLETSLVNFVSSANITFLDFSHTVEDHYIDEKIEPNILPCGTPEVTGKILIGCGYDQLNNL